MSVSLQKVYYDFNVKSSLERSKTTDREIRFKSFEIIQFTGKNGKGEIKEMNVLEKKD